jgi:uncharacterized membrane protein YraQ (UPF0718 family)
MSEFLASFLDRFPHELWTILLDSGVWLIVGFALAGAVHALIPRGFISRQLAGRGAWPIAKASLLGIPLPLCSCSVIPVAAGLRRAGAGRGASAAFAISTPQTGEESIPLTWALFGPVFALTRPVVAIATAFTAGMLIDATDTPGSAAAKNKSKAGASADGDAVKPCCAAKHAPTPAATAKPCCSSHAADPGPARTVSLGVMNQPAPPAPAKRSLAERAREGLKHGFVTMPVDLAVWLSVGLVLAATIAAAVPEGWIAEHIGTGLLPMLAMLVVGVPLYICATSSTPLAFSLVAAGLSPGAALVLLLAGPATNVATMGWVLKDLGARALAIYLGVIAVFAVGFGVAFDAFFAGAVRLADDTHLHDHAMAGPIMTIGAVALVALLAASLGVRGVRWAGARRAAGRPGVTAAA